MALATLVSLIYLIQTPSSACSAPRPVFRPMQASALALVPKATQNSALMLWLALDVFVHGWSRAIHSPQTRLGSGF